MNRDRVVRIMAPNPSPMTLDGTNSYLVFGSDGAIVIDPGPDDPAHVEALTGAARSRDTTIAAIAVTHGHPDHAPGAALLGARTGAPVYAHTNARFPHDAVLRDADEIAVGDVRLHALDAPGHADDHLVFSLAAEAALFTGDVVVGRGTVVVAPPRGDMRAYQATLRRLRDEFPGARVLYGGHGEIVTDPRAKLDEYIAHREARERQLLAALGAQQRTIPELVAMLYRDVSPVLWPAAARQVLAYLIALEREGTVRGRQLERAPTAEERAILDPDLSAMVDARSVAVAAAELGYERHLDHVDAYALMLKR